MPEAMASAKMAPVEVPAIQSKQWRAGTPQISSIERSIRVRTWNETSYRITLYGLLKTICPYSAKIYSIVEGNYLSVDTDQRITRVYLIPTLVKFLNTKKKKFIIAVNYHCKVFSKNHSYGYGLEKEAALSTPENEVLIKIVITFSDFSKNLKMSGLQTKPVMVLLL